MTHFLQRTALIALASGALGACSTETGGLLKPNYPVRATDAQGAAQPAAQTPTQAPAQSPAPPPPPPEADVPLRAAPAEAVQQRPLDAPPPAPPVTPAPLPVPPPAPVRAVPAPVAAPVYRNVTTRTVTGRVVEVEGRAVTYRVRKGDTLDEISDKLGTTVSQLRHDNGLKKRSKIHPGQVLKGPRSAGRAYVAGQGDTLYSIAKRFGVTADALREENRLRDGAGLRPGQKIRLPDGFRDRGPLTTTARVLVASAQSAAADQGGALTPDQDETPTPTPTTTAAPRTTPQVAAPPAAFSTVTARSVTGKVVKVEGRAESYKVKKGDNLAKIARKLHTTVDQLRADNGLKKRARIQPGDVLDGPRSTASAYVAGQGDTLFGIARRFGVSPEALREENDLSHNAALRSGQKIRLPEGYRDHGPLTTTMRVPVPAPQPAYAPAPTAAQPLPAPAPVPAATPTAPQPYTPPARPYAPPRIYTPPPANSAGPVAAPTAAPTPADAQVSALGRGRFIWPIQGAIISDFGPKAPGQRNDGINIAAQVGASVRSAAAGDVVYAGDQVPGFGNLVLIKHPDGWVTAYGHLSRVLVKMQQKVTQGQEIGLAGATGGVSEPQLHFEIRYAPSALERAKPIDPKLVLPAG